MIKFKTSPKKFTENIQREVGVQVKDMVNDLFVRIVTRNPVDTGYSSGNWNVSYNKGDLSTRGSKENPPSPINKLQNAKGLWNRGKTIHIANGVEYIEVLEDGNDRNPPRKFVALSLAEIDAKYS